jgi:hypothetical protein
MDPARVVRVKTIGFIRILSSREMDDARVGRDALI